MWTLPIQPQKPLLTLSVEGSLITGIADTGAEQSCFPIVMAKQWPTSPGPMVTGATGSQMSSQSTTPLSWEDSEGNKGHFTPLFLPNLPTVLWGRDILNQSGAALTNERSCYPQC